MTFGCCCFDHRLANSRAGWRGLARSRPVMKAALAHHLVAPVEPPANQHKSDGERCDAEDYIQRHGVTTTTQVAAGILIFTVVVHTPGTRPGLCRGPPTTSNDNREIVLPLSYLGWLTRENWPWSETPVNRVPIKCRLHCRTLVLIILQRFMGRKDDRP